MKKAAFVLSLAVVLVMGLAGSAYASYSNSGYLAPDGSPHGGYTTSSKKCAVCHAVHQATATGEVLMRDSVANACVYCHISTFTGEIKIYDGDPANYNSGDLKNAHSVAGGAKCTNCHTPHGATSMIATNDYLRAKILKTSGTVTSPIGSGDTNEVAVSKWCTNCHEYYETGYDKGAQTSHVMTMASANYPGGGTAAGTYTGKVAWSNSDTCRACHADGAIDVAGTLSSGETTLVASSFPHYTAGQRFLTAAGNDTNSVAAVSATDSSADGVCIRCHVSSGVGVGQTF